VPTFVVSAGTTAHVIPGTVVTIAVFGNNGEPAGAFVSGQTSAIADANGEATFSGLELNKAGGYTITATATYGGVPTGFAVSARFNIKNK